MCVIVGRQISFLCLFRDHGFSILRFVYHITPSGCPEMKGEGAGWLGNVSHWAEASPILWKMFKFFVAHFTVSTKTIKL